MFCMGGQQKGLFLNVLYGRAAKGSFSEVLHGTGANGSFLDVLYGRAANGSFLNVPLLFSWRLRLCMYVGAHQGWPGARWGLFWAGLRLGLSVL